MSQASEYAAACASAKAEAERRAAEAAAYAAPAPLVFDQPGLYAEVVAEEQGAAVRLAGPPSGVIPLDQAAALGAWLVEVCGE